MAKSWICERCHAENEEGKYSCSTCGMLRGAVVVPGTAWTPPGSPPESPTELGGSTPPAPTPGASTPGTPWGRSSPDSVGFASIGGAADKPSALPSDLPPAAQGVGAPLAIGSNDPASGAGWVPPYPIAPPPSRPIWRRIPLGLLIFGVLIVGGAVAGFISNAGRSSSGDINHAGDLTSNDLRVGDCWDLKDPTADTVDNVTARPCNEPHEYEVFYIASMAEGDYPTEDAFTQYVNATCVPQFATFVGMGYNDSTLEITWLYPQSDGWTAGDRTIECAVYDPANNKLTSSLKFARR